VLETYSGQTQHRTDQILSLRDNFSKPIDENWQFGMLTGVPSAGSGGGNACLAFEWARITEPVRDDRRSPEYHGMGKELLDA
jgi:hypothetical protein